jgi:putative transposase
MARLGRTFQPGQPLHVIQRGNNRGAIFLFEDDCPQYRGWFAEAAEVHRWHIIATSTHAYVFMTNHIHLLVTPQREESS